MKLISCMFEKVFFMCFLLSVLVRCQQRSSRLGKFNPRITKPLQSLKADYAEFLNELVRPITVERISGTPQNTAVKEWIATKMRSYGWHVEFDSFQDNTPFGRKSFSNIIANYAIGKQMVNIDSAANKQALFETSNRVVLACHFDSKMIKGVKFLAATDSAVPCALMLDLAKFLKDNFPDKSQFNHLSRHLQFIFFDGEEAFVDWTSTDSIYGSRNYAKVLNQRYQGKDGFNSMELFILLDLIGSVQSRFPNYFPDQTGKAYSFMSRIESLLQSKNMLNKKTPYFFVDHSGNGKWQLVEDDHKPFLAEGVPVLHMIPSPFPNQWHTANDNLLNLDQNNIQDIRMILKHFVLSTILNTNEEESSNETKHMPDDEF